MAYAEVRIVDDAQELSNFALSSIEQETEHSAFHYSIFTLETLGGKTIKEVAQKLHQDSGTVDAVIVVSMEEEEAFVHAWGESEFDRTVAKFGGSDPYGTLIDEAFFSGYEHGGVEGGLISLLSTVEGLYQERKAEEEQGAAPASVPQTGDGDGLGWIIGLSGTAILIGIFFLMWNKRRNKAAQRKT